MQRSSTTLECSVLPIKVSTTYMHAQATLMIFSVKSIEAWTSIDILLMPTVTHCTGTPKAALKQKRLNTPSRHLVGGTLGLRLFVQSSCFPILSLRSANVRTDAKEYDTGPPSGHSYVMKIRGRSLHMTCAFRYIFRWIRRLVGCFL